jgi:MinD superfamily P-loop ATPase
MKELIICSGKGGTGKTSVAAALAALVLPDTPAVLADCDVDAADLHLVVPPLRTEEFPFTGGHLAVIDPEVCAACGQCYELCRFDAIARVEGPEGPIYRVDPLHCEGCGVCVHFCPTEAIAFPRAVNGVWFRSDTAGQTLYHARLTPGQENSGKLVTLVREKAREEARDKGANLLLVDGPPGIGCPTTAAITGADLVLAVTEPGVSGWHDLERLIKLTRHFEVPLAVCINKADINPEFSGRIEQECRQRGVPLVGRIPFDQAITQAQLQGCSVVEIEPGPAAEALHDVWKQTLKLLTEDTE